MRSKHHRRLAPVSSLIERMESRYLLAFTDLGVGGGAAGNSAAIEAEPAASYAAFADQPELPRVYLDTTYVPSQGGNVINVPAGGNVQQAINNAQLGDTIVLAAGATYSGNFTLPNKTTGSGWITIRTSTPDASFPGPGTRITPAQTNLMPKLVAPNNAPALATQAGAHHYRIIGVEFTIAANVTQNFGIVVLGGGTSQTTANTPHNLIFDRVYIHGTATADIQNGMRLNSASTAVIDSYFDQCQASAPPGAGGYESHNIGGYNGPGPYKLVNNTFSGATIPVIFGGAVPSVQGLIPSDLEIRGNHFTRPRSWRPGDPSYVANDWYVKNLFELKNAQRVLFDGNVLEHNWPQAGSTVDGSPQHGFAILLTVRGENGNAPWTTVSDVTLTNNIIRKSNVGVSISGTEGTGTRRIKIENNLFDDIGLNWGNNDRSGMFIQANTVGDLIVNHNTIINDGDILFANGAEAGDLVFTNNIVNHNAARTINRNYGINGVGTAVGTATLDGKFVQYEVTKNAMANASGYTTRYPAGNFFPANFAGVGFVDLANRNYRLAANSVYRNAGTDGKDLGADFDALLAATAGSITGVWTPPTVSSITRLDPSPTFASSARWTVTFSMPVTGVDLADFALAATGGTSGAAIVSVTGSGNTYTVTASTGSGDGVLGLNLVDNDSIANASGLKLGGAGGGNGDFTGQTYSLLRANPTFTGTAASDMYYVRRAGANVEVLAGQSPSGAPLFVAPFATVQTLSFSTGLGADVLYLDASAGSPIPAGGVFFNAGPDQTNSLVPIGATPGALAITNGTVRLNDGLLVSSLSFAGTGRLDVAGHPLVVDVLTSVDVQPGLLALRELLASGKVFSSSASASLAVAYADLASVPPSHPAAVQARSMGADDFSIVTLLTPPGDASLDGVVTADDRALFDRGRAMGRIGWINGDFNHDGVIDAVDEAFLNAGTAASPVAVAAPAVAPLANAIEPETRTVAVGKKLTLKARPKPNVRYTWRVVRNGKLVATSSGPTLQFTPQATGRYTVRLVAIGRGGRPVAALAETWEFLARPPVRQ